jgi:tetratricopeptide (TPR) repeat protein
MVEAYESALEKANGLAGTTDKIAANVLMALNEAIATYGDGKVDKTNAEALETAINALKKASDLAETSIKSYKIISSGMVSTDALDGWVCENSNKFQVNTWSTEGEFDGTGMTNTVNGSSTTNFIENWVGRADVLGDGRVYYQLAGLQPGETYYAQALVRAYSEAGNIPNGPNFFVNNTITDMTTNGKEFEYKGMKGYYGVLGGVATVGEDGIICIGVVIEDANYNWVAFKNVSIQTMDDALEAAVNKVTSLEGKVPATVYETAYETVEAYTGDNKPSTAKEFETAIAAIEEAALEAQPFVKPYETWLEVKKEAEALFAGKNGLLDILTSESEVVEAATDVSEVTSSTDRIASLNHSVRAWAEMKALADALVDTPNDNAAANQEFAANISTLNAEIEGADDESYIDEVTAQLRDAMIAYVGVASPADGHQFDITFLLTNPDLTGLGNGQKEGWFTDQEEPTQNCQAMTTNKEIANSEDDTMYAMYEYWSSNTEATEGFTVYQNVLLSKGSYSVSAYCMSTYGNGAVYDDPETKNVTLSAGDTDGDKITSATLEKTTLNFTQEEVGEVKIGLKAHEGNTANWMGIGYLHLYKVAEGESTGISEIENGRLKIENTVYDMQGRRICSSTLKKGIYIINGKKVLVK